MKLTNVIALSALLFSAHSFADFNLSGKGKLVLSNKQEMPIDFGFSFQTLDEEEGVFNVGGYQMETDEVPESYSIFITLQNDNIWVQEFAKGMIESFDYKLGDHSLSVRKTPLRQGSPGSYEILLDDMPYVFFNKTVQVSFRFTQDGISGVELTGAKQG